MTSGLDSSLRGKVAIVGIGLSPVGSVPGQSPLALTATAAKHALADCGLTRKDIDGVLSGSAIASPFHRFSVAFSEYFGLAPTFSNTLQASGATAARSDPSGRRRVSEPCRTRSVLSSERQGCSDPILTPSPRFPRYERGPRA